MSRQAAGADHDRGFRLVFAACALLAVGPLWLVAYPPGTDLPQHAAQVALAHAAYSGAFTEQLVIDWATPYMLGYALAFLLAYVLPAKAAVLVVLSAGVVAIPLSVAWALENRAATWWSLAALPAALAFPYQKGFLNFLIAIPLFLLLVGAVRRYGAAPGRRVVILLAVLGILLTLAHAALAAVGLAIAAVMLALQTRRSVGRALLPLLPGIMLLALWLVPMVAAGGAGTMAMRWDLDARRPLDVLLLAVGGEGEAAKLLLLASVAAGLALAGARPSRNLRDAVPLAAIALIALLAPATMLGVGYVYQRFAALLIPALLLALRPATVRGIGRVVLSLAVLAWLGAAAERMLRYDREAAGLRTVLHAAGPGGRLLYIPLEPRSRIFAAGPYAHAGAWYTAEQGGLADLSFAASAQVVVRYRAGCEPALPHAFHRFPGSFEWHAHAAPFDLFLVRSTRDTGRLFDGHAVLIRRAGDWWLYRRTPPHPDRDAHVCGEAGIQPADLSGGIRSLR